MSRACLALVLFSLVFLAAAPAHASPWGRVRARTTTRLGRIARSIGRTRQRIVDSKPLERVAAAAKRTARWIKANPGKAAKIGLGGAAMFAVVFYAAPALASGVGAALVPVVGKTGATIVGTAAGGALASGSRSLLVHSTPMVLGVDPLNKKQLAMDVGMSSGFGFVGFAHAASLRTLTRALGASGVGLLAVNAVGLIGYEVLKDYFQNRMRNRVANDPKRFRDIWKSSLLMETVSNLHRCIPGLGLETNFGAKVLGDLGGTIWWDRIINRRNAASTSAAATGAAKSSTSSTSKDVAPTACRVVALPLSKQP